MKRMVVMAPVAMQHTVMNSFCLSDNTFMRILKIHEQEEHERQKHI